MNCRKLLVSCKTYVLKFFTFYVLKLFIFQKNEERNLLYVKEQDTLLLTVYMRLLFMEFVFDAMLCYNLGDENYVASHI